MTDLNDTPVILEDVSVTYRLPKNRTVSIKEFLLLKLRGRIHYEDLIALDNVSLTVKRGESLGIIGGNGAGKSTLLKVIARVVVPGGGRAKISGRIAPVLDLSAGFDYELTGRENIHLIGSVLGFGRKEILRRLPSVVEFSGLEAFLESPVRTYSDGMRARLCFAIASDMDAEILIIDEMLGIGDLQFREKCKARIRRFRKDGVTILLVSHQPDLIRSHCDRALWLDRGRVMALGPTERVVRAYEEFSDGPEKRPGGSNG